MKTQPGAVRMSFALRALGDTHRGAALLVLPLARAADERAFGHEHARRSPRNG